MPDTSVTVTEYEGGDGVTRTQYRTTIPKALAEANEMDTTTKLRWTTLPGDKLQVEIIDD